MERLCGSGLITGDGRSRSPHRWSIDHRHPSYTLLLATLDAIVGSQHRPRLPTENLRPAVLSAEMPLGHRSAAAFKVIHALVVADEPLALDTILRRIPMHWRTTIVNAVAALEAGGVLEVGVDGIALAASVPSPYRDLVRSIGTQIDLGVSDARGRKPAAYLSASDGAPRLFGTDVRLRHLMALAVHGPLYRSDLRRLTGGYLHMEDRGTAPFGRGGLVRVVGSGASAIVDLDEMHPLHPPLHRLLVALELTYPLPKVALRTPSPLPPAGPWSGDRLALFGSAVPMAILMTLGTPRRWTFEAVCCEVATGFDRVVVKKAIRRLEAEGVLEGSRPRGPGFGPRLLRLAAGFPAREELQALIDAIPIAWPDLGDRITAAFDGLPEKTKAYFRRRGLI